MACRAPPSVVTQASNAGRSHAALSVLTYNVKMSWDGDAPWMNTQDLQFFASGDRVEI
jgi:hypothetical protein